MRDIIVSGRLEDHPDVVYDDVTKVATYIDGHIIIEAGSTLEIQTDATLHRILMQGGDTPETASTLIIGGKDGTTAGVSVRFVVSTSVTAHALIHNAIDTQGHCNITIQYSNIGQTGDGFPFSPANLSARGEELYPTLNNINLHVVCRYVSFLGHRAGGNHGRSVFLMGRNIILEKVQLIGFRAVMYVSEPPPDNSFEIYTNEIATDSGDVLGFSSVGNEEVTIRDEAPEFITIGRHASVRAVDCAIDRIRVGRGDAGRTLTFAYTFDYTVRGLGENYEHLVVGTWLNRQNQDARGSERQAEVEGFLQTSPHTYQKAEDILIYGLPTTGTSSNWLAFEYEDQDNRLMRWIRGTSTFFLRDTWSLHFMTADVLMQYTFNVRKLGYNHIRLDYGSTTINEGVMTLGESTGSRFSREGILGIRNDARERNEAGDIGGIHFILDGTKDYYYTGLEDIGHIDSIQRFYDVFHRILVNNLRIDSRILRMEDKTLIIDELFPLSASLPTDTEAITLLWAEEETFTEDGIRGIRIKVLPGTVLNDFDFCTAIRGVISEDLEGVILATTMKTDTDLRKVYVNDLIPPQAWGVRWHFWNVENPTADDITTGDIRTPMLVTSDESYTVVVDGMNLFRTEPKTFVANEEMETLVVGATDVAETMQTPLNPHFTPDQGQQVAMDTLIYQPAQTRFLIKLPSNYATNERWNATTRRWTYLASDFQAIAYRIEEEQAEIASLTGEAIDVKVSEIILRPDCPITFYQSGSNPSCTVDIGYWNIRRLWDDTNRDSFINNGGGIIVNPRRATVIGEPTQTSGTNANTWGITPYLGTGSGFYLLDE